MDQRVPVSALVPPRWPLLGLVCLIVLVAIVAGLGLLWAALALAAWLLVSL